MNEFTLAIFKKNGIKKNPSWSRWPSGLEWWSIMSVLKCAFSPSSDTFAKTCRVIGYRVCQLILCHNMLILDEWQIL